MKLQIFGHFWPTKKGSLIRLNLMSNPKVTEGSWAEEHGTKVVKNSSFGGALVQLSRNTSVAENEIYFFNEITGWDSKITFALENL